MILIVGCRTDLQQPIQGDLPLLRGDRLGQGQGSFVKFDLHPHPCTSLKHHKAELCQELAASVNVLKPGVVLTACW